MYFCRLHKLHVTFEGFSQILNSGNRRQKSTFGVPGGKYVSISPLYQLSHEMTEARRRSYEFGTRLPVAANQR